MKLTVDEETVLRKLALQGDLEGRQVDTKAFDGLQVLGYARRSGANGYGRFIKITPRGLLKALSVGMIDHHPDDMQSSVLTLRQMSVMN